MEKKTPNGTIGVFRGIVVKTMPDEYFKDKEILIPITMAQWIDKLEKYVEMYRNSEFKSFIKELEAMHEKQT